MSQPNRSRARMRVPRMNSCLYAEFGFGARCFQAVLRCDAFDRGDLLALDLGGHDQATVDESAIEDDIARAAVAVVAALLGAGQLQLVAEHFKQAVAWLAEEIGFLAVDGAGDME